MKSEYLNTILLNFEQCSLHESKVLSPSSCALMLFSGSDSQPECLTSFGPPPRNTRIVLHGVRSVAELDATLKKMDIRSSHLL